MCRWTWFAKIRIDNDRICWSVLERDPMERSIADWVVGPLRVQQSIIWTEPWHISTCSGGSNVWFAIEMEMKKKVKMKEANGRCRLAVESFSSGQVWCRSGWPRFHGSYDWSCPWLFWSIWPIKWPLDPSQLGPYRTFNVARPITSIASKMKIGNFSKKDPRVRKTF